MFKTEYNINRKKEGNEPQKVETSQQIYKSLAMSKYLANLVIYNKFKFLNILNVIKIITKEWSPHVVRMAGESTVTKLLEGKPGGGREK